MNAFLVCVAAAALVSVGTPAVADVPVFNGFGRAMTAQRAIEKAIDDAENSASGEGLFNCELIAEPIVWPPDATKVSFTASVDMICV